MNSRRVVIAAVLMVLLGAAGAAAEPDFREGLWEITAEVSMPGMPMRMPPSTRTQCLTKEDMVPAAPSGDQQCTVRNVKVQGNTVSYDLSCSAPGNEMQGHGEVTYAGETLQGKMQMRMPTQGNLPMTSTYKGRRLGPCP
jgi:hypothetical protein